MFQCERVSATCVLFAAILFIPQFVQCKPGIETIRNKYGLDEIPRYDGTNENQVVDSLPKGETERRVQESIHESLEDNEDYEYYDEVMARSLVFEGKPLAVAVGRSLLVSERKTTSSPKDPVQNIGKCYRDRLTGAFLTWNSSNHFGNDSKSKLLIYEFCCNGYEQYVHDPSMCVPVCSKNCVNGFCISPDVCVCFPDHIKSLAGDCVATCPIGCLNGQCHMNGTCACHPGYILEPNRNFCVPYCSRGCGSFANCTAPEFCSCIDGYTFNYESGQCEPICNPPCLYGQCIQPNLCLCSEGYLVINNMCQANCSRGCENGRCVANEVCACEPGWTLHPSRDKCLPHCSSLCPNGKCEGPETCTCNDGYIKKDGQCKPHCPRGCKYGTCTAPNKCKCRSGYYFNQMSGKCSKVRHSWSNADKEPIYDAEVVINPKPQAPIYNPPVEIYPVYPQVQAPPYPYPQTNVYPPSPQIQSHPIAPPIYNPEIQSMPSNPRLKTSMHPQFNIYPGSSAVNSDLQPPLYNPPIQSYPIGLQNQQPLYNAQISTQESYRNPPPSAPHATSAGNHSSIYDKQPAYNPFFRPDEAPPAPLQEPTYLEKQPSHNPYFIQSSPKSVISETTTHPKHLDKTTTWKTILSFGSWGESNKSTQRPEVRTTRQIRSSTKTTKPAKHKITTRQKHHNMTATTKAWRSVLTNILGSLKNRTEKSKAKTTARPDCSRACLNGRCIGMNQCSCNSGYVMAAGSNHKCIPHCRKGCSNGSCTGPNHCVCKIGYKKLHEKCVKV